MHSVTVYKIRRVALAALYAMIFWLAGCKDPLETTLPNAGSNAAQQKPYLTFRSFDDFNKTIDKLAQQSPAQRQASEPLQGFTSLQQFFDKAIAEEAANYEQEEKLCKLDPKINLVHQKSATASKMGKMIIYDEVDGGIRLNIANPKMANVLNKEGVVCINKVFYQFSYSAVKSIPQLGDEAATLASLDAATQTNEAKQINVGEITHRIKPLYDANARGNLRPGRSCFSQTGTPYEWKLIGYIDELQSRYAVQYPIQVPTGGGYFITQYDTHYFNESAVLITVRTLTRGFWGDWYDRTSSLQRVVATYRFTPGSSFGTLGQSYRSDIPGGYSAGYFNLQPSGSNATSNWAITVFANTVEENSGQTAPSNVLLATSSLFKFSWEGAYGCQCDVGY